jgi:hypothetical protein
VKINNLMPWRFKKPSSLAAQGGSAAFAIKLQMVKVFLERPSQIGRLSNNAPFDALRW